MYKYIIGCLLLLNACTASLQKNETTEVPLQTIRPKYAKGFWIEVFETHKTIHIRNTYDTTQILDTYVIANASEKPNTNNTFIAKPIQKNVCLSTTQIGFLELLHLTDSIIALSDTKRIFNAAILQNIAAGKTSSIGNNGIVSEEKLLALKPSVVFAYSFSEGNSHLPKLRSMGLNIVLINDYNETHPLARAEWIKMIAAFYDKEQLADSIFTSIETTYLQLAAQVAGKQNKPTVFCNLPWKEVWYMPSGNSYFAKFIEDAGGNFLWKETSTTRTLNLDFEAVFLKAANASVWLNPNSAKTLQEIADQNLKFKNFNAFKNNQIFNCNKLENSDGGNAFWETGVVQPQLVLKDLISIFHPDVLPNHTFVYYQKLGNGK